MEKMNRSVHSRCLLNKMQMALLLVLGVSDSVVLGKSQTLQDALSISEWITEIRR